MEMIGPLERASASSIPSRGLGTDRVANNPMFIEYQRSEGVGVVSYEANGYDLGEWRSVGGIMESGQRFYNRVLLK